MKVTKNFTYRNARRKEEKREEEESQKEEEIQESHEVNIYHEVSNFCVERQEILQAARGISDLGPTLIQRLKLNLRVKNMMNHQFIKRPVQLSNSQATTMTTWMISGSTQEKINNL